MKIQDRLAYQFTGITSIILLVFSFIVLFFSKRFIERDFYKNLESRAEITGIIYLEEDEISASAMNRYRKMYMQTLSEEFTKIYNLVGEQVFFETDDDFVLSEDHFNEILNNKKLHARIGDRQLSGIYYTDNQGDFIIIASAIDEAGINKLNNLQFIVFLTLIVSIGASFVAGKVFARQSLIPLKKVVNQIGSIKPDKMSLRVTEGNGKDEISELASSFNMMLERLQQSFEIQKTFVSNASHELRTPLTGISMELEMALMKERNNAEYKETLVSVQEEIEKLSLITENILNFAKASFDISNIPFKAVRIDDLIYEAQALAKKKYHGKKINIVFNDPVDDSYLMVYANEQLMLICLKNIIENAIKFSEEDEKIKIEILSDIEQKIITIKIRDQGIGIPENDLQNIFITFFRGSNIGSIEGFGVGLSLSKRIIELHKGIIEIDSKERKGTLVCLKIPVYQPEKK